MTLTQIKPLGLSKPVDLADNEKIRLGTGNDLELYHTGTNSLIDNNTGDLYINSAGGIFIAPNNNEAGVYVRPNGAVELYHDNNKTFETTADGCKIPNVDFLFVGANASRTIYFDASINGFVWNDNAAAYFGNGQDLQIYHDGGHSYIRDTGTGNLRIGAQELRLQTDDFNENYIIGNKNDAVILYYDGLAKLATTSWGTTITGTLVASSNIKTASDTGKVMSGAGDDLQLYHDGSNSYLTNSAGALTIRNTDGSNLDIFSYGSARIRVNAGEIGVDCSHNSSTDLYYDNSKKFETHSNGAKVSGVLGVGLDPQSAHNSTYVVQGKASSQCLFVAFRTEDGTNLSSNGMLMGLDNNYHYLLGRENRPLQLGANSTLSVEIDTSGHFRPTANNTRDLGASDRRWRNIYTNDLNLSNEGSSNDMDGSWGNWTIQEGESDLFLKNNRSGKKYKFNLTEVT